MQQRKEVGPRIEAPTIEQGHTFEIRLWKLYYKTGPPLVLVVHN